MAVGAAAVWAGVRAAVWFPGCVARRLGAGCGARSSFCSVLAALVFSSPPTAVWITPAASVCVCVLGVIPGDAGVTVTPAQAAAPALPRATHPGGETQEQWRGPRGGDPEGLVAATSNLPGEGLPLAAPLFVVWGSAPPPLPPRARSVRLGVGMSQRRPPLAFLGNLGVRMQPLPPRSGIRRTPGALGADSPGLSSSSPSPRTHTSALRPARVWRAVESAQARGLGSPPSSGRPRVPNGSQSQGYAGMAGGGVVDQVRLPRIHLGAGESPREGMREPRFPEPPF